MAIFVFVALIIWVLARRPIAAEVERLREDLHALLGRDPDEVGRLAVNGRPSNFVDITASINRLIERREEEIARDEESNPLFDAIARTLPDIALIHKTEILFANAAAGALFGLEPASLIGKPTTDLLRPAYRSLLRKQIEAGLRSTAELEPLEVQLISADDTERWVELHSTRTQYEGEPALITVAKDIAHRKNLEVSLGRSKLQARITLESIGEGIITTDRNGTIDYMNEAAEQLLGILRSSAVGKRTSDLIALIDEADRESLGDPVEQCLAERKRISLGRRALLLTKESDREFSVELTTSPIRGPGGEIAGCVAIFHDVTELRGLAREMSYQATHDALTGLVNKAEFERRLDTALDSLRTDGTGCVVSYLDLDRFKVVNDTCGHIAGDNLLREVAGLLKRQVRDSDTVARMGGDEFAMLLAGCPLDKARQIAEEVCDAVANHSFVWQDQVFEVGVSIGLVEVGPESVSAESVLNAADSACYVAKQQGRGGHHVYSARDEMLAREKGEILWLQRLQRALREDQFELYFQPIVATEGGNVRGPAAELLLRMRGEGGTRYTPSQFISSAERYQLMGSVDRWVLRHALAMLASGAPKLPSDRSCSVNLSGQTLLDDSFLEFVVDALDHSGVEPERICFEVTEQAVMSNLDHARRFISVLHGIGCNFAIDNFGSGIGSFAKLKSLSIDYLKIDGTYTRNLETDPINREMITAMIKLARQLDFKVIAEQVEDSESFDALRRLGVDFIQGFSVERPRPIDVS